MALEVGSRLGHYDVTALIGEGGMGQVYQATDTKLNRQVALKILPEAFAEDPDRLARFQREAQVLASLNHPNIAAIHGLEESDDTRALVLELVEGPTLADRIAQGPIPVDEALPIAKQIAEALEAAHEQGVIHRDLKPANIRVRPDGTVKVLDFGLAKAMEGSGSDASESPTMTAAATASGVILGTAAYMSPEQARGKLVDKRADIWAFGAVLYEMLTGKRPFKGRDVSEVLAAVIQSAPDWDLLPGDTPPHLNVYLKRCLEKEPKQRVHDIADVRLAMEGAFETIASAPSEHIVAPKLPVWQRPVTIAVMALATLAVGGGAVWTLSRPAPPRVSRLTIPLAADQDFSGTNLPLVAISPDGTQVVYVANRSLWLRPVDSLQAVQVPSTEGASMPFFSADGQSVGFYEGERELFQKVDVSGGAPVTLANVPWVPHGASWGADDMILYGQPDGIWQVAGASGTPELLMPIDEGDVYGPQVLPGGEWVLFTLRASALGPWSAAQIVAQSVASGERTVLIDGGRDGRYLPTGHLVYSLNNVLFAVPFDVTSRRVTGGPVPLVEGVREASGTIGPWRGAAHFSVSTNGSLAYVPRAEESAPPRNLVWVNRDGEEELVPSPPRDYRYVSLSPDGTRAAVEIGSNEGTDVWVVELSRGTLERITTHPAEDTNPLWSPDGQRLLFVSIRSGRFELLWKSADGSGDVEVLTRFDDDGVYEVRPYSWTPDGSTVAVPPANPGTGPDIGMLLADGTGEWEPLIQTPDSEYDPAISPNGRWLAYRSDLTGVDEVYVDRYPDLGDRQLVSVDGGFQPRWSPDSHELIYRNCCPNTSLMSVSIEETGGDPASLRVGQPEPLLDWRYYLAGRLSYDLTPDGERFLMITSDPEGEEEGIQQIVLVQNWFQELTERVPIP